jgi:hypothetical protein
MIQQNVYSVGTATTTVVAPTVDAAHFTLKNLEPSATVLGDYARYGDTYLIDRFISLPGAGTALFLFETGNLAAQFDYWSFYSTVEQVKGDLIEGATITSTGTAVPAYNMNRNFPDTYQAKIESATAVTGGTVIVSEIVSSSKAAGGGMSSAKIVTLRPNTRYGFRFTNLGNQATSLQIQIAFVEKHNGYNTIWLGTLDNSFALRGGEEISMYLQPQATINAVAGTDDCKLAVIRQD